MLTRPDDLLDAQLIEVIGASWGLRVDDLEYIAIGFGSYHWRAITGAGQRFVTVDDLELKKRDQAEPVDASLRRLSSALETASILRQAGMDFVVAPVRDSAGATVRTRLRMTS